MSTRCGTIFQWTPISTANGYRVFISETEDFNNDAVQSFDTSNTQWPLNRAKVDGTFYWKVHTVNSKGDLGPASNSSRVTIEKVSQITDIYPSPEESSYPYQLHPFEEKLLFIARQPTLDYSYNFELFATNDTYGAAQMIEDLHPNNFQPNSTYLSAPSDLVTLENWVYFIGDDGAKGNRIRRTNGIRSDTQMLKSDAYSAPTELTVFGGKLYFAAESVNYGRELWVTDGTEAGTHQIHDIFTGRNGSNPSDLTVAGNWLYFKADDGQHGYEVWRTNGETTTMVADIYNGKFSSTPIHFVSVNDHLFFAANDHLNGSNNLEIWTIYENTGGVHAEKTPEINTETDSTSTSRSQNGHNSYPSFLSSINDTILAFSAYHPDTGQEAYIYDLENEAGHQQITENPNGSSHPANFVAIDEKLFFTASDANGIEQLWRFDLDNRANPPMNLSESVGIHSPRNLIVFSGNLYFSAFHSKYGRELWTTNGTAANTNLVTDIYPGTSSSAPANLIVHNNRLVMTAFNEDSGEELYQLCE